MLPEQQKKEVFVVENKVLDLQDAIKGNSISKRQDIVETISLLAEELNFWQNDGDLNRKEKLSKKKDMDLFYITQDLRDLSDNIMYCKHQPKSIIMDLEAIAQKLREWQNG